MYVNVASKRNNQKNFEKKQDPELDPNPDQLVRATDPGILIRTKMQRIRNTAFNFVSAFFYLRQFLFRGDLFPSFHFHCLAVLVVRPGGFNSFS
jgi:hypothetical protein